MKFKFTAVLLIIIFCFVKSFAQEREFEIEVSMVETKVSRSAEEIPVKVKITNKAVETLNTSGLETVNLTFAKCEILKRCNRLGDVYEAHFRIPSKNLKEKESFEFEVNLAGLHWLSPMVSKLVLDKPKNFTTEVPKENIYLKASIRFLAGYKKDVRTNKNVPNYKTFNSNTIVVTLE